MTPSAVHDEELVVPLWGAKDEPGEHLMAAALVAWRRKERSEA
jgi:hypothetical protein